MSENSPTTPSSPPPIPSPPPSLVGWLVKIIIYAAAAGGVGWYFYHEYRKPPAPVAAPAGPPARTIEVQAVTVQPTTVPITMEYLGQTEALQRVEIRSRVQAFLEARLFDEGKLVRQGDPLFRMERAPFEAEMDAAKAAVAQATARHDQNQRQVDRYRKLVTTGAATRNELEDFETALAVSAADIQAAQARIRQADLNLKYTKIEAPLTGMIGKTLKDVGSYCSPSDNLLAVVQQIDPLYVEFPLTERDLLRWRGLASDSAHPGQIDVEVVMVDGKRYPHPGQVNFVAVQVDPRAGTAHVRASLPNPDLVLRPGQLLRVRVMGLRRKNVITVPQKAVIQTPAGAMVYVINDQSQVQPSPVVLGEWVQDQWVIESGLKAGQRVAVDHLMQLRPMTTVKATEAPAGPTTAPALAASEKNPAEDLPPALDGAPATAPAIGKSLPRALSPDSRPATQEAQTRHVR